MTLSSLRVPSSQDVGHTAYLLPPLIAMRPQVGRDQRPLDMPSNSPKLNKNLSVEDDNPNVGNNWTYQAHPLVALTLLRPYLPSLQPPFIIMIFPPSPEMFEVRRRTRCNRLKHKLLLISIFQSVAEFLVVNILLIGKGEYSVPWS